MWERPKICGWVVKMELRWFLWYGVRFKRVVLDESVILLLIRYYTIHQIMYYALKYEFTYGVVKYYHSIL